MQYAWVDSTHELWIGEYKHAREFGVLIREGIRPNRRLNVPMASWLRGCKMNARNAAVSLCAALWAMLGSQPYNEEG